MLTEVPQTHEEKVKMYMKSTKLELIEMLIECNKVLKIMTPIIKSNKNEQSKV